MTRENRSTERRRRANLRGMRIVLSNCPVADAERIARVLVEEGRAACVSLVPVRSFYRWQGKLCADEEVTLLIKVSKEGAPALRDRLRALHPYELPEIVALAVDEAASLASYLAWVRDAAAPPAPTHASPTDEVY